MKLRNPKKKKLIRRGVSLAVAFAMLLNEFFVWSIIDNIPLLGNSSKVQTTAYAAEVEDDDPDVPHDNEETKEIRIPLENFKEYSDSCQIYSTNTL